MADTLSYETCCKLRDAGLEQRGSLAVWSESMTAPEHIARSTFAMWQGNPRPTCVACPNSDDLLAALQARWPDHYVTLQAGKFNRPCASAFHEDDPAKEIAEEGDTPAAALAALYIELAKEPTP
jgi:hypothetical protein